MKTGPAPTDGSFITTKVYVDGVLVPTANVDVVKEMSTKHPSLENGSFLAGQASFDILTDRGTDDELYPNPLSKNDFTVPRAGEPVIIYTCVEDALTGEEHTYRSFTGVVESSSGDPYDPVVHVEAIEPVENFQERASHPAVFYENYGTYTDRTGYLGEHSIYTNGKRGSWSRPTDIHIRSFTWDTPFSKNSGLTTEAILMRFLRHGGVGVFPPIDPTRTVASCPMEGFFEDRETRNGGVLTPEMGAIVKDFNPWQAVYGLTYKGWIYPARTGTGTGTATLEIFFPWLNETRNNFQIGLSHVDVGEVGIRVDKTNDTTLRLYDPFVPTNEAFIHPDPSEVVESAYSTLAYDRLPTNVVLKVKVNADGTGTFALVAGGQVSATVTSSKKIFQTKAEPGAMTQVVTQRPFMVNVVGESTFTSPKTTFDTFKANLVSNLQGGVHEFVPTVKDRSVMQVLQEVQEAFAASIWYDTEGRLRIEPCDFLTRPAEKPLVRTFATDDTVQNSFKWRHDALKKTKSFLFKTREVTAKSADPRSTAPADSGFRSPRVGETPTELKIPAGTTLDFVYEPEDDEEWDYWWLSPITHTQPKWDVDFKSVFNGWSISGSPTISLTFERFGLKGMLLKYRIGGTGVVRTSTTKNADGTPTALVTPLVKVNRSVKWEDKEVKRSILDAREVHEHNASWYLNGRTETAKTPDLNRVFNWLKTETNREERFEAQDVGIFPDLRLELGDRVAIAVDNGATTVLQGAITKISTSHGNGFTQTIRVVPSSEIPFNPDDFIEEMDDDDQALWIDAEVQGEMELSWPTVTSSAVSMPASSRVAYNVTYPTSTTFKVTATMN